MAPESSDTENSGALAPGRFSLAYGVELNGFDLVWLSCLYPVRCYTKARIATGDLMNVLLIGAGGREHALAWALSASPLSTKLYCAPGNPGIAEVAECTPVDPADHDAIIRFCQTERIVLVV